jgi:hypothetical protein
MSQVSEADASFHSRSEIDCGKLRDAKRLLLDFIARPAPADLFDDFVGRDAL